MRTSSDDPLLLCQSFLGKHPEARHGPAYEVLDDHNFSDKAIDFAIASIDARLQNRQLQGRQMDIPTLKATRRLVTQLRQIPEATRVARSCTR